MTDIELINLYFNSSECKNSSVQSAWFRHYALVKDQKQSTNKAMLWNL